jgi:DNA-binding NarL/FixJ family response regulator
VLALLLEGLAVKEIVAKLGIKWNTVAGHMKVIYREAGVHSRRELRERAGPSAGGGAGPAVGARSALVGSS